MAGSTQPGSAVVATRSNTYCRCSVSTRRTGTPDTPKPKARSNGSTRRCNAGYAPDQKPKRSASCRNNSTSSATTTTSTDPIEHSSERLQGTPIAPPPKRSQPAPEHKGTTGCATTASTPTATSASAVAAACTTSESAPPTNTSASSRSPTTTKSRSSCSTPAR